MSNPKKKILKHFVLLISFVMVVVLTVGIVAGYAMIWGVKRNMISFKDLNTSGQIMLNDSLQKVTGNHLTIKKITYNEYNNGVKNYVFTFKEAKKLEIDSKYFYELNDKFADSNSNTGYYYKKNKLYIIIGDRDYTRINDVEEKEILKALCELTNALTEVFENN